MHMVTELITTDSELFLPWYDANPIFAQNVTEAQDWRGMNWGSGNFAVQLDTALRIGRPSEVVTFLRDKGVDLKYLVELLWRIGVSAYYVEEESVVRLVDGYTRVGNGISPVYADVSFESAALPIMT